MAICGCARRAGKYPPARCPPEHDALAFVSQIPYARAMKIRHALTLLTLSLGACVTPQPHPVPPPGGSGKYVGPIRTEWEHGRKMRLLEDAQYIAPDGRVWLAPQGWSIDGASIPKVFWCSVGGPFEDAYREASVFHDVACDQQTARWQDVHRMFYTGMRCSGVDEEKAKIMYAAVYRFGPRWPEPQARGSGSGPKIARSAAVRPTPTEAEAGQLEAWIRHSKPTLKQIEQTTALPGASAP